jgi:hypothetical protein
MLFRLVNRTVYAEDLASTNGTVVNGLSANHQVVHHLDLIEVGRHKLHFFDDSMLAASVTDIESTVHDRIRAHHARRSTFRSAQRRHGGAGARDGARAASREDDDSTARAPSAAIRRSACSPMEHDQPASRPADGAQGVAGERIGRSDRARQAEHDDRHRRARTPRSS